MKPQKLDFKSDATTTFDQISEAVLHIIVLACLVYILKDVEKLNDD